MAVNPARRNPFNKPMPTTEVIPVNPALNPIRIAGQGNPVNPVTGMTARAPGAPITTVGTSAPGTLPLIPGRPVGTALVPGTVVPGRTPLTGAQPGTLQPGRGGPTLDPFRPGVTPTFDALGRPIPNPNVPGGALDPFRDPTTVPTPQPPVVPPGPSILPTDKVPGTTGPGLPSPTGPTVAIDPLTGQPYPQQTQPQGTGFSPFSSVNDYMNQLLDTNGAYMQNARQRGIEDAAARGLGNSSIAAGNAQRAAIESAQPLVNQMVAMQQQREGFAFQGEQSQLDRNQATSQLRENAQLQDWLSAQGFQREFNATLSMMPIQSANQLNTLIQQYALENPDVYTQDVISGMTNFFNNNFTQLLRSMYPGQFGGTP